MPPLWALLLAAQEADPPRVRHELRVYVFEELDEENEHERYEQAAPLELPFLTRGPSGSVEQRVSLHSACRWRTPRPSLSASSAFPWLPDGAPPAQDGGPWESTPPPAPRFREDFPARGTQTVPLELTLRFHTYTTRMKTGGGSTFDLDPLTTTGTPIGPPPPTGTPFVPGPPGSPPPPPPVTKSVFGDGGAEDADNSSSPYLMGPELGVPLKTDVSEWDALRWLPEGSGLSLYAHVLFGDMLAFDQAFEVTLYGAGPRLGIPLLAGALSADLRCSAGPAFLSSDLGDTAGADVAAGAGARLRLVGTLSLVASAEYRGFFAPDLRAYGPSFNLGVDWDW